MKELHATIKEFPAVYASFGNVTVNGGAGTPGGYYIPDVSEDGVLSWTATEETMPPVPSVDISGPEGPEGPQGPQGIQGERGPQGLPGEKGETGTQGPKGDKGDKGDTGEQGPKGEKGDTGAQGPKGDDYVLTEEDKKEIAGMIPSGGVSFTTDETLYLENGVLGVNTATNVEGDNTLPITSAAVFETVGNIEILLKTI